MVEKRNARILSQEAVSLDDPPTFRRPTRPGLNRHHLIDFVGVVVGHFSFAFGPSFGPGDCSPSANPALFGQSDRLYFRSFCHLHAILGICRYRLRCFIGPSPTVSEFAPKAGLLVRSEPKRGLLSTARTPKLGRIGRRVVEKTAPNSR
jgi:hypothetical protein